MFFPENVIFDWDNTLVDSNHHLKWVMDETLQTLKTQGYLATKSIPCYWQMPLSKLFAEYPAYVARKAAKMYINLYQELPYLKMHLFEGAQDILNFLLRNKANLYIISNKKGCFVRREALNLKVNQYFKSICGAGDTNYQKPSKEIVEKALKKTFCREKTLFVGDSILDLQCAANAQIKCILISNEIKEKDKHLVILPDLKLFLGYLKTINISKNNLS